MRQIIASLLLALAALTPALAQQPPPALVVSLRDVKGAGVAGVAVVLTDRSGVMVLARGTTEADGAVSFGPLPVADVRVRVAGQLPGGAVLSQPGQDAPGIALTLGGPSVRLELRSEADGTVRPDPAGISLEPGVPLDSLDLPLPSTSLPAATAQPTTPTLLTDAPVLEEASAPSTLWLGLILFASLLLGLLGVLLLQMRGRHS